MSQDDERLMKIEMALAEQEKMLGELNEVLIEQGRQIERLLKQNRYLISKLDEDSVKPQSEETPPPHY